MYDQRKRAYYEGALKSVIETAIRRISIAMDVERKSIRDQNLRAIIDMLRDADDSARSTASRLIIEDADRKLNTKEEPRG